MSLAQSEKNRYAVTAAWVLPVDGPPIQNGAVVIDSDSKRILAVDTLSALQAAGLLPAEVIDLENSVIIPGLINAHTHLEFSDLRRPLGEPGIGFTDWIRAIVAERTGNLVQKNEAVRSGLKESFSCGVWAIGEIATLPLDDSQYLRDDDSRIHCTVFLEQLGRDPATRPNMRSQAEHFLSQGSSRLVQRGVSPHAPYSTHPDLVRQLCDQAAGANGCVAMHLAETLEEREIIEQQTGPFVDLLKSFGVWDSNSFQPSVSISDLLLTLAQAPRSLVVHGNYLTPDELDLIAGHCERMSIVFCPRTHHYFGHSAYPLPAMLKRGINVAIGTDSRASNPDLQILPELREVHRSIEGVSPNQLLKMATINGAIALGIDDRLGSLSPGKSAAMSLISKEDAAAIADPFFWIGDDRAVCRPVIDGSA